MSKGKAFVLVGHRNWGKSWTLEALTYGSAHVRWLTIGERYFFIRRMSNDDVTTNRPDRFWDFVKGLDPNAYPNLIVTLCPNFTESLPKTKQVLQHLSRGYELFFFVLRHKYGSDSTITDEEIERLKKFGTVKVYTKRDAEPDTRAKAFRDFIESSLRASKSR